MHLKKLVLFIFCVTLWGSSATQAEIKPITIEPCDENPSFCTYLKVIIQPPEGWYHDEEFSYKGIVIFLPDGQGKDSPVFISVKPEISVTVHPDGQPKPKSVLHRARLKTFDEYFARHFEITDRNRAVSLMPPIASHSNEFVFKVFKSWHTRIGETPIDAYNYYMTAIGVDEDAEGKRYFVNIHLYAKTEADLEGAKSDFEALLRNYYAPR